MPYPASARQRKPHGPGAKPRGIVAARRRADRPPKPNAEGLLLRLVARLSVDARHSATVREAHGHYVRGCVAMLEALGEVRRDRAITLLTACNELLGGHLNLQDIRAMNTAAANADTTYLRAVSLVRRAGQADAGRLAGEMDISLRVARELIDCMEISGVVGAPDMFGTRLVLVQEVAHG